MCPSRFIVYNTGSMSYMRKSVLEFSYFPGKKWSHKFNLGSCQPNITNTLHEARNELHFFLKSGSSYKKLNKGLILYIFTCIGDCRRGFGLQIGFTGHSNTQLVTTLIIPPSLNPTFNISLQHILSLFSLLYLYQQFPGNGF
jgi:hypothetical protein